ncbi:hypothetical protein [uncultured Modestobacter sp.]|uniref:hypothetical protein n=1 Tax=uncultured Modestobacter sp. TaxID=380048 RepID=UPI0026160395|nr:hypothetical protein [uncultured Modestobacter sp.]
MPGTELSAAGGSGTFGWFYALVPDPFWQAVVAVGLGVLVFVVGTWWHRRSGGE